VIRQGGLVAFPTETFYGLGANALDAEAVGRVFQAKGRPADKPLLVLVTSVAMVAEVAAEVPPLARRLMTRFWPGPLTLVSASRVIR
jgi:L-threonylcarbamoyladenylate synthase